MTQPSLFKPRTHLEMIADALAGGWKTPHEVIRTLPPRKNGKPYSDAAITARFRDLRKPRFGGYTVYSRPREGRDSFEYSLGVM